MKIAGWIPLKKHSTRLPGKNWRNFGGKPLYRHMADTLLTVCPGVFINTDNAELQSWHPALEIFSRKLAHCEPTQSPVQMLIDDLAYMRADVVVNCHATIPLLRPETLQAAVNFFIENYPRYDSVISVTRLHERYYDHLGRPINFHPGVVLPLQDMPPTYLENSAFFIMHADDLRHLHRRVGDRPYMYEIDKNEAVEIDDQEDFEYAEWLYQRQNGQPDIEAQEEEYNAAIVNKFDLIMNAGRIV